jgi:hypothetical protein
VDTTLVAQGSRYDKLLPLPDGNRILKLAGGNLAAEQLTAVAITGGIPPLPTRSLITWKSPSNKGTSPTGIFTITVTLPGVTKPVKGSGIYLQKSGRAWGFFPGTTLGGRVEVAVSWRGALERIKVLPAHRNYRYARLSGHAVRQFTKITPA